jgi:hypothetical protein
MLNVCVKYGIQQYVINAIEAEEYCNITQWKQMVKSLIDDQYDKRWNVTHTLYKSLGYLSAYQHVMSPWWQHAHDNPKIFYQSRLIIQLLLNKSRHQHGICKCCMAYVPISTEHALFECEAIGGLRKVLWSKFEDKSPWC